MADRDASHTHLYAALSSPRGPGLPQKWAANTCHSADLVLANCSSFHGVVTPCACGGLLLNRASHQCPGPDHVALLIYASHCYAACSHLALTARHALHVANWQGRQPVTAPAEAGVLGQFMQHPPSRRSPISCFRHSSSLPKAAGSPAGVKSGNAA